MNFGKSLSHVSSQQRLHLMGHMDKAYCLSDGGINLLYTSGCKICRLGSTSVAESGQKQQNVSNTLLPSEGTRVNAGVKEQR